MEHRDAVRTYSSLYKVHPFTPPCLLTSACFPLTFREGRRRDESEVECDRERDKVKTQMKEECQRVAMAFTMNCDGSGSLDLSIKTNRSERGEEMRRPVVPEMTKVGSFIKISSLQRIVAAGKNYQVV